MLWASIIIDKITIVNRIIKIQEFRYSGENAGMLGDPRPANVTPTVNTKRFVFKSKATNNKVEPIDELFSDSIIEYFENIEDND